MQESADTIAAVATGAGRAGIGVVRVSGPLVPEIAKLITGRALGLRQAHYLPFTDSLGDIIDVGIAIRFEAPDSYTGEHVLELQGHGGPVVLDMLLSRVLECGARLSRPGEFTEIAFLNEKLDLAQAEAVADLINTSSSSAAKAAVRSMAGHFSTNIDGINQELISLRAWLEAALDFSEEDIDFLADPQLANRARDLLVRFDDLLSRAQQGQLLRDGLTIVIAGAANVGKSSLLNSLSGTNSAIVTEVAGTTRDLLHEHITLAGVPLHIIDTAGLRDTEDAVELEGMKRAREAIESVDHALIMLDADNMEMPKLDLTSTLQCTLLINKTDLLTHAQQESLVHRATTLFQQSVLATHAKVIASLVLSVKTGQGMAGLHAHLLSLAGHDASVEGVFLARRRHLDAIEHARDFTSAALARLIDKQMPELAAEELRLAQQSLESITGRFDADDLLGQIFSQFCIGK